MEAGRLRLRPILMTAFAFIFGVLPLMFATGAGAASRQSLGTDGVRRHAGGDRADAGLRAGVLCPHRAGAGRRARRPCRRPSRAPAPNTERRNDDRSIPCASEIGRRRRSPCSAARRSSACAIAGERHRRRESRRAAGDDGDARAGVAGRQEDAADLSRLSRPGRGDPRHLAAGARLRLYRSRSRPPTAPT